MVAERGTTLTIINAGAGHNCEVVEKTASACAGQQVQVHILALSFTSHVDSSAFRAFLAGGAPSACKTPKHKQTPTISNVVNAYL